MEIDFKDAFQLAVKLSLRPGKKPYQLLLLTAGKHGSSFVNFLLDQPLFTTTLAAVVAILILVICITSLTVITGVLCLIVPILLLEGFVIITVLVSICVTSLISGMAVIIFFVTVNNLFIIE